VKVGVGPCVRKLQEEGVDVLDACQYHLMGGWHVGLGASLRGIHLHDFSVRFVAMDELSVHLTVVLGF